MRPHRSSKGRQLQVLTTFCLSPYVLIREVKFTSENWSQNQIRDTLRFIVGPIYTIFMSFVDWSDN